jgi:hypothetical protein
MYPQKTSCENFLAITFERKTAFSAIYKPKCAGNHPFFAVFVYLGQLGRLV